MKKMETNKQTTREAKREKILDEKKKSPLVKVAIILLVATVPLAWFLFKGSPDAGSAANAGSKVMDQVNYRNQNIAMTRIDASLAAGSVEIPLDAVKEKKLVYFEYASGREKVPLMAYITPGGNLVTAVSMCEPCKSTKFHIENEQMVCNACGTRWTLEGLRGVSGGCLQYPPDVTAHRIEGGKVKINEKIVRDWKPRV